MSRQLLMIDDDPKLARLLQEYAADFGYELHYADRPSRGRELLTPAIELILMDVMMPEQDGFSFCRELRASGVKTPIIILTGRGEELDTLRGLALGANDCLAKPFAARELFSRVEAVLHQPAGD